MQNYSSNETREVGQTALIYLTTYTENGKPK